MIIILRSKVGVHYGKVSTKVDGLREQGSHAKGFKGIAEGLTRDGKLTAEHRKAFRASR